MHLQLTSLGDVYCTECMEFYIAINTTSDGGSPSLIFFSIVNVHCRKTIEMRSQNQGDELATIPVSLDSPPPCFFSSNTFPYTKLASA